MSLNKNFSIVLNDCQSRFVYQKLGLEYNTPFMWGNGQMGLFMIYVE